MAKNKSFDGFKARVQNRIDSVPKYLLNEGAYFLHYPPTEEQITIAKKKFKFVEEIENDPIKQLKAEISRERHSSGEHRLIAGIENKIYCLAPDGKKIFVKKRDDWVRALVVHDNRLFDGGLYKKVFDTLNDRVVAERADYVRTLVSHDGRLFDGGRYCKVFDTLDNRIVAERDHYIRALVSHDGRLFDGGSYMKVYDTLDKRVVAVRDNWVLALVSHGGRLFDGGGYKKVFDTLDKRVVAERDDWVDALVSHGGRLFDGGSYRKVFDSLNDPKGKNPLWSFDGSVTALASVPMSIWNELASNGRVVK